MTYFRTKYGTSVSFLLVNVFDLLFNFEAIWVKIYVVQVKMIYMGKLITVKHVRSVKQRKIYAIVFPRTMVWILKTINSYYIDIQ